MKTIFLKDLKLTRKGLIIWLIIMILTAGMGVLEYPMIAKEADTLVSTLGNLPRIVRILFGVDGMSFQQSSDFYITMYFWYCLVVFTHAIYVGATIVAREERDKTAEYIFAKPYKRSEILTAKILVGIFHVSIMALTTWLINIGLLLPMLDGKSILGLVNITTFGMFVTQLVFFGIGLLCTAVFKRYRLGLTTAMMILLGSFIVAVIIEYLGNVEYLNFLTPFRYFPAMKLAAEGISLIYLLISAAVLGGTIYLTYGLYNKKDLLT